MELIKNKLLNKPHDVEAYKPIKININNVDVDSELENQGPLTLGSTNKQGGPLIVDKRKAAAADEPIDRNLLLAKLKRSLHNRHIPVVFNKPVLDTFVRGEGEEEMGEGEGEADAEGIVDLSAKIRKTKRENVQLRIRGEGEPGEGEGEGNVVILKQPRKTKAIERGVATLGEEVYLNIGDTKIPDRMPRLAPQIKIHVDSYYMNNRERFINFINSIFEPYKEELKRDTENINCDNIGKSGDVSLLTHQAIVRDYMNLYTPYHGVLLFHGLGAGKTGTSISIAEGMKNSKKIIVLTPASLRRNYIEELKKFGEGLYRKDQFWEWIAVDRNTPQRNEILRVLSNVLNLPMEYISRKKGAWLINIKKPSNFGALSGDEKKSIDDQLDTMIQSKYLFINYNGLRFSQLKTLTANFTRNLFDDAVVIVDEAHNLISRIVNKIKLDPAFMPASKTAALRRKMKGEKLVPKFVATRLYEDLLSAKNSRIVLISGTPVINYPNEFGILFNILRGYIKTWTMQLIVKTADKVNNDLIREILQPEKTLDYLDYSPSSKILTITRNPFGFRNVYKGKNGSYSGVATMDAHIDDGQFERNVIRLLQERGIEIAPQSVHVTNYKALPDTFEEFNERFINPNTNELINVDALKRRIVGLTSYFRSTNEKLLPKFSHTLGLDYHIVNIPMSEVQFASYESARAGERETEKQNRTRRQKQDESKIDELYEPTSTYRIMSRLFCNYVVPNRPVVSEDERKQRAAKRKAKLVKEGAVKDGGDAEDSDSDSELDELSIMDTMEGGVGRCPPGTRRNKKTGECEPTKNSATLDEIDPKQLEMIDAAAEVVNPPTPTVVAPTVVAPKKSVGIVPRRAKKVLLLDPIEEPEGAEPEGAELEGVEAAAEAAAKPVNEDAEEAAEEVEETLEEEAETINDADEAPEEEEEGDDIMAKLGGLLYKEQLQKALKMIKANPQTYLSPTGLEIYSPKFLHILENIKDPEHIGLHLVYSQFRTMEGLGIFSLVLEANGIIRFRLSKNEATGQWAINMKEIREHGGQTYALYTGTESAEEKEILRNIYNGDWEYIPTNIAHELRAFTDNNNLGQVIKVFMITASGSEGINLRNTRYVHLMEPYWHPVRLEQVIGRARRICSHKGLPEKLQTVEVFLYLMVFSKAQLESDKSIELRLHDKGQLNPAGGPVTTDQYLFEVSELKNLITSQLVEVAKETAFDCQIYGQANCMNFTNPGPNDFAYVPDYMKQENDSLAMVNKKKIEWKAVKINIGDAVYAGKKVGNNYEIYDLKSYQLGNPVHIGNLEVRDGKTIFHTIVR